MSVKTGENEQGLKKIMDLTRGVAIIILMLHFYYHGYNVFQHLGWTAKLSDNLLHNIERTGLFFPFYKAKIISLIAITLSLIGTKGKKEEKANLRSALLYMTIGLLIYFGCVIITWLPADIKTILTLYIASAIAGLLLFIHGGAIIAKMIKHRLDDNVFNDENETFPQEERLLENAYSVHFTTEYYYRKRKRTGQINL